MNKHTSGILVTLLSVLLLNLLLLSPSVRAQSGDEVLTNEEVISMLKAGLSPTVIVNKIRTSKTRFNLSTNELIRLKQAGLSDEILQAMQGTSETPDNPTFSPASTSVRETNDQNNPMAYHDVGIYGYSERGGTKKLSEMEPNVSTQSRTGGTLGTSVTYGIWPTKVKARIPGTSANFQVYEAQPVFYFYLNAKDRTMRAVKYLPASINQFQLVKFTIKGKSREVTVGRSNLLGSNTGIHDSNIVEFSFEKVGDGVYKITPRTSLKNGEYGFYLLGTGSSVGATFYDFSVRMLP